MPNDEGEKKGSRGQKGRGQGIEGARVKEQGPRDQGVEGPRVKKKTNIEQNAE
jgi:hypothetical protein